MMRQIQTKLPFSRLLLRVEFGGGITQEVTIKETPY